MVYRRLVPTSLPLPAQPPYPHRFLRARACRSQQRHLPRPRPPFTPATSASFARDDSNNVTLVTAAPHNLKTGAFATISGFAFRTGTYSQAGSAVTVTITGHGLTTGAQVFVEFYQWRRTARRVQHHCCRREHLHHCSTGFRYPVRRCAVGHPGPEHYGRYYGRRRYDAHVPSSWSRCHDDREHRRQGRSRWRGACTQLRVHMVHSMAGGVCRLHPV